MNELGVRVLPSPQQLEAALETLVRAPQFSASPRLQSFVRFVTAETLAGRAAHVKAFTIARHVYGRDETFDPQTSSLVRVEASRLRKALAAYYAGPGAESEVEIRITKGSYVPSFVVKARPAIEIAPAAARIAAIGTRQPRGHLLPFAMAFVIVCAGMAALWMSKELAARGPAEILSSAAQAAAPSNPVK